MRQTKYLLFSLTVLTVLLSCSRKDTDIARINGRYYDRSAVYDVFNPAYFDALNPQEQRAKLEDWAVRVSAKTAMESMDSLRKAEYLADIRRWEDEKLLQALFEHAIIIPAAGGEAGLRELHNRLSQERRVKHILVSTDNPARNVILGRLEKELDLSTFDRFAMQYSDDKTSAVNGGDLGFVRTGQMVANFDSLVFNSELNALVGPFETMYGTHYLTVTDEHPLDTVSFEDNRAKLMAMAASFKSERVAALAKIYLDSLMAANPLDVYTRNCTLLADSIQAARTRDRSLPLTGRTLIQILSAFDTDRLPLASNESGTLYGSWLKYNLGFYKDRNTEFKTPNQIESFIREHYRNSLLAAEARRLGLDLDEALVREKNRVSYEIAYKNFRDLAEEKVAVSDDEVLGYYNENKDELYSDPPQVQVQEIFVKDSLLAESIVDKVEAGENFDSLATLYTERNYSKDKKGILPFFRNGRYGDMGKAAFAGGIGELSGPHFISDGYSVIRILDKKPAAYKEFKTVRKKAEASLLREKKSKASDKAFSQLRKKLNVGIYADAL